jgi:hypothetical protein
MEYFWRIQKEMNIRELSHLYTQRHPVAGLMGHIKIIW